MKTRIIVIGILCALILTAIVLTVFEKSRHPRVTPQADTPAAASTR
ncbi:hypothetical protein [Dyella solisilvae]|nr:hypothetical protein [Dyella solisilvae]